jgi:hypothetical protein
VEAKRAMVVVESRVELVRLMDTAAGSVSKVEIDENNIL